MAGLLAVTGVVMLLFSRNAPGWTPSTAPALPRMREAMRLKATWQCAFLYAVVFGGFVAFSTYLPTLLQNVYAFSQTDAGLRAAGFSIAAVIARPLGGIVSDRLGPVRVLLIALAGAVVMALVLMLNPPLEVPAGAGFVLMAFFLGLGSGGVFALVAKLVEPSRVGTVTGLVGAAGGLGGYFPPLVMGVVYSSFGTYAVGYVLLAVTAAAAILYTWKAFPSGSTGAGVGGARVLRPAALRRRPHPG
nr:hypothetical protein GCM10020093_100760 [Planobispora longispora]